MRKMGIDSAGGGKRSRSWLDKDVNRRKSKVEEDLENVEGHRGGRGRGRK
jgi:hypothetical protein